ncbi:MAG: hypothetical protein LBN27_08315 [Prevotellaceae bacterium]|jgi:DNA modification methylase|nr:hypothetical protein [Prevotellaceae bacterium]
MAINKLNELSGKEWIRFTRSWFYINAKSRTNDEIQHPAKYPEELVQEFVSFFTKSGEMVFDPFVGVGSTIVGCQQLSRYCIGIELNKDFVKIAEPRINAQFGKIIQGDCRRKILKIPDESVNFIITSPPYWDILKKKRGNSDSQHTERNEKGLSLYYSDKKNDLGNIDNYEVFIDELAKVFKMCKNKLKTGGYMVVVVQNFRNVDGSYMTLAWDLARKISEFTNFCGEKIWVQENKKLGIWGYPTTFISNIHHHYCLIFRKK